jgi:hypothetical protein
MNNFSEFNRDFDPDKLREYLSSLNQDTLGNVLAEMGHRFLAGKWRSICAWRDQAHADSRKDPLWHLALQPNGITDVGIHYALDRFTNVGSPGANTWYAGLVDNAGFTGDSPSDTMASHSGWTENQDYSEAVRQTLAFSAAASRTISDSVSFSINATVTIRGLFVTSDNTKGGTTGTLFSTALFGTPPALVSGNVLTANYSLSD